MTSGSLQAVILAGGLGTRLRPAVGDLPKPLAPVKGRPFLEYQLEWLKRQGITRVLLCIGYRHDLVKAHFGTGRQFGLEISYSVEGQPLGTAGAIALARTMLDDTFLLANGDTFFDTNLGPLFATHEHNDAVLSMALVSVANTIRQGAVVVDGNHIITGFIEKGRSGPGLINAGIYIVSSRIFDYFPDRRPLSMETDIFPVLLASRLLCGCPMQGYHIDIGTPESYAEFEHHLT